MFLDGFVLVVEAAAVVGVCAYVFVAPAYLGFGFVLFVVVDGVVVGVAAAEVGVELSGFVACVAVAACVAYAAAVYEAAVFVA